MKKINQIIKIIETITPYIGFALTILTALILIPVLFSGFKIDFFTVFSFIGILMFFYDTCKLWLNTRLKGE